GESQPLAMSHRVNFGPITGASNEGINRRNRPVIAKPQYLAGKVIRILCTRRARRVSGADAHVNHSVLTEHNVRRIAALNGGKNIARIDERASVPPAARERNRSCIIAGGGVCAGWLVVCEVDQL